jgi:hypothetical protein
VDLRLAMEWVVLCAHCLSFSEALLSIWGECVVFFCTIFENLEVGWLNPRPRSLHWACYPPKLLASSP